MLSRSIPLYGNDGFHRTNLLDLREMDVWGLLKAETNRNGSIGCTYAMHASTVPLDITELYDRGGLSHASFVPIGSEYETRQSLEREIETLEMIHRIAEKVSRDFHRGGECDE